ncbi:MAG: hypothetical protein ACUVQ7_04995 [bacterium]
MKHVILFVFMSSILLILGCSSEREGLPEVDMVPPNPPAAVSVEILDQEVYGSWVLISWAQNSEPDLAGYKVYKSSCKDGPFTLACRSLVRCPWYYDNIVPAEVTYYRVTAVDESGNESAYSLTTGVYWNQGREGEGKRSVVE